MPNIIHTYRKDKRHKPGHGYGRFVAEEWHATRLAPMSSEVIHTTNNSKPTSIEAEARFLRDSPDVSCHDLIAKNGDVYVILPDDIIAWHAGKCIATFDNFKSCGTELHVSDGETPTKEQIESLTIRIQERRQKYGITKEHIDTHRAVALPKGRKADPEGWSNTSFYRWRDALFVADDWSARWGTAWPYFAESGIARAWRDAWRLGNQLGEARTDEFAIDGGVCRAFASGYVTWNERQGTRVYRW